MSLTHFHPTRAVRSFCARWQADDGCVAMEYFTMLVAAGVVISLAWIYLGALAGLLTVLGFAGLFGLSELSTRRGQARMRSDDEPTSDD